MSVGVHKKGGPTILDDDKFTLQGMVNRAVDKGSTLRAQSVCRNTVFIYISFFLTTGA